MIFILEAAPFPEQVLVCVGAGRKAVRRWLVKRDADKSFRRMVDDALAERPAEAFVCVEDGVPGTLLVMPQFADAWGWWETLIHELHHVVSCMAEKRRFEGEKEVQAHLQQYLFRLVRATMMGPAS